MGRLVVHFPLARGRWYDAPMKLYYHPLSGSARKVLVTAHLLGTPLELALVDLARDEARTPAFLAMNPNGKVPVLVDGGFALWESHAIMTYLCDKAPGQTLYPTEPVARADVNRWLFWASSEWTPPIAALSFELHIKRLLGAGPPDPARVERHQKTFRELAGVLDGHLESRSWLAQDRLTLADVAVGTLLMLTERGRLPVEPFTNVTRWFERLRGLEAWSATEPGPR